LEVNRVDGLFELSHALAEFKRLLARLGLLVSDTVQEVAKTEIKQGIAFVYD